MKSLFTFLLTVSLFAGHLQSQSQIYSTPVVVVDEYIRDSAHVVGQLDLDFPEDGMVFIHFDGVVISSKYDRIVLAANNQPIWMANHGTTNIIADSAGESNCFSHTRHYPVTAGPQSFYAIAHNFVTLEGTGIVSIYGRLTVEYIPQSAGVISAHSIRYSYFNGLLPVAYDSVTIQATGPGKAEVRLNGFVYMSSGDVIVAAISDTKNWDYTDPFGITLETDVSGSPFPGISTTRLYDIPEAGTYTFYAMGQRGYEYGGSGEYYPYTHLHARYYPDAGHYTLASTPIAWSNDTLPTDLRILDSIVVDVATAGKIEVRFDGNMQSTIGDSILLAVNNQPFYTSEDGNVRLQTTEADEDRRFFVHTNVFDVTPGTHTFYAMVHNLKGVANGTTSIYGHLFVKHCPEAEITSSASVHDLPFQVYPNPAHDQIQIQSPLISDNLNLEIFNTGGIRVMQTKVYNTASIQIPSLNPGIYFVKVTNGHEAGIRKIVIE